MTHMVYVAEDIEWRRLRFDWGDSYDLSLDGEGRFWARRRDGGGELWSYTIAGLRFQVSVDHHANPVTVPGEVRAS